jgi:octaprenyl-diphosphate synthase
MHARVLKAEELNWLKVQFEERQILMKCYAQAKELIDEAVELMNQLGEDALSEIAMEMIDREF